MTTKNNKRSQNQLNVGTMKAIFSLLLLVMGFNLFAQSDIPIYGWKSYLPYLEGRLVVQSDTKIYYATEWSIFSIDKTDNSISFLSKVEGLSDICISEMTYDAFNGQLIVAYNNSKIDFIKDQEVFEVSDIKDNSNLIGDRGINDIEVVNNEFCYLATAFGVVEYNLIKLEFGFTTSPEIRVFDITSSNGFLYAATEDGIYKVSMTDNLNLRDFSIWQLLEENVGLPTGYESKHITTYNGHVYASIENQVFRETDSGSFEEVFIDARANYQINFLSPGTTSLMMGSWDGTFASDVFFLLDDGTTLMSEEGCLLITKGALEDENGKIWFADEGNGIKTADGKGEECNFPKTYNSPNSETASDICFLNNEVYVASGGVSDEFGSLDYQRGFYKLQENKTWKNYNKFSLPNVTPLSLVNLWKVKEHPTENKLFIGSYYSGLLEFDIDTEEVTVYDKDSSLLQGADGDNQRTRVSGLEFDRDGNLWIANYAADKPLSVMTPEGQWFSYSMSSNKKVAELTIDRQGYKWFIAGGISGGVYAFDDGGTLDNTSDDRVAFFNVANSALSTNLVSSIKADLNGDVWVGTAEGPVVFECGGDVFNNPNCVGTRRKVLQDSIAAFLLQTEDIRRIEVDGANRKWFGTRKGIYVQSEDGEEQILHLNEENSPLFDNTITALSFNAETGEMFVGTNKGLQAFRTDATGPAVFHNETSIYAFPNPVRPDYDGPIAIKGLVENADVKITDINGRLVYETTSLGGQAIWNGLDYNGVRSATGVYLVFSSSTDNSQDPDSFVTKILFLN